MLSLPFLYGNHRHFHCIFRILMSHFNIYFHVVLAYYHEWRHNKMVYSKIIRVSAFLCHFHLCNWHQRSACEASKMANYKRWSFPRIVHFNGKSRFGINMLYVNHKGYDTPWREDRRPLSVKWSHAVSSLNCDYILPFWLVPTEITSAFMDISNIINSVEQTRLRVQ